MKTEIKEREWNFGRTGIPAKYDITEVKDGETRCVALICYGKTREYDDKIYKACFKTVSHEEAIKNGQLIRQAPKLLILIEQILSQNIFASAIELDHPSFDFEGWEEKAKRVIEDINRTHKRLFKEDYDT